MTRILVTGSRDWTDHGAVAAALTEAWHDAAQNGPGGLTIVHGAAPGADSSAARWAHDNRTYGVTGERHPAEWSLCAPDCPPDPKHRRRRRNGSTFCPGAGPRRNALMVGLGADLCLAFPLGVSEGTRGCMELAEAAGIPVVDVTL